MLLFSGLLIDVFRHHVVAAAEQCLGLTDANQSDGGTRGGTQANQGRQSLDRPGTGPSFGGFLMLPTMGANWWVGLLAIAANVVVTGVVYALIKKDIPADQLDAVQSSSAEEEELDLDDIKVM